MVACAIAILPTVIASCCRERCNTCDDGTDPFSACCGRGKCNIFCCNCNGDCRTGRSCGKRDVFAELAERAVSGHASFQAADLDGTGNLTLERYLEYMKVKEDDPRFTKWFAE
jgi:hypothetical protein